MRHSSLTYKLPLYNGDIKSLQDDSSHVQADVLLKVYTQKQDAHRKKLIKTLEDDFYTKTDKIDTNEVLLYHIKSDPELRRMVLDALVAPDAHF